MNRVDHVANASVEWGQEIYLETEMAFVAVGRPSLAQVSLD